MGLLGLMVSAGIKDMYVIRIICASNPIYKHTQTWPISKNFNNKMIFSLQSQYILLKRDNERIYIYK